MKLIRKCANCKYNFRDSSVGYSECTKADDFDDDEFEVYDIYGFLNDCPYFEKEREQA